jgi:hypothetical protein
MPIRRSRTAKSFRLGKKPPRVDARTLRLANYLTSDLPPPPLSSSTYTDVPVADFPMDGNDTIGDCTIAAAAHLLAEWTALAQGSAVVVPSSEVEQDYFQLTGGPDTGLDLLTVLNWWRKTGFSGADGKIDAYAALSLNTPSELEQSVVLFGGSYLGLALPDFAAKPPGGNLLGVPWVIPSGPTPPPDPNAGHCVPAVGYDDENVYVVTWGAIKAMSWGFYAAYVDEAFAVISPGWLNAQGTTPSGLNLAQLDQDLQAITSSEPSSS